VPNSVFSNLSKSAQSNSRDAQLALKSVQDAVMEKSDVRILTPKGEDITKLELNKRVDSGLENQTEGAENQNEAILQIVRRATDLSIKENPPNAPSPGRSAILLTEDRLTRVRAAGEKIAALAPSMIKRILTSTRRRASSANDENKPMGLFATEATKQPSGHTEHMVQ